MEQPATNKGKRGKYKYETKEFWYNLCVQFHENKAKYGNQMTTFLAHEDSGEYVSNTVPFKKKMSRNYKAFKEGKLNPDYIGMGQKQIRDGVHPQIEAGFASELERIKEAGEPWPEKVEQLKIARKIAQDLEIEGFGGTYAWLNGVVKRRKICGPTAKTIDFDDCKIAALDQKNNHGGSDGAAMMEQTHNTTGDNPMIARGIDVLQMKNGSF